MDYCKTVYASNFKSYSFNSYWDFDKMLFEHKAKCMCLYFFRDFCGNLCALNVTVEPLTLNLESPSFNSQPGVSSSDSGI
jgi:hypothetical protein